MFAVIGPGGVLATGHFRAVRHRVLACPGVGVGFALRAVWSGWFGRCRHGLWGDFGAGRRLLTTTACHASQSCEDGCGSNAISY
jgi:hypothetical protein